MRYDAVARLRPAKGISVSVPRAGIQIDTREELINALQEAIQVEHGLMLQYLFTAISCKRRPQEGLTEDDVELIRQWEGKILRVARDEMAHLATACNLISAIGGSPDFNRPNFPQAENQWFPFGFSLERLNPESVARFVRAESPKPPPAIVAESIAPEPIEYDYVGELYSLIAAGFRNLAQGETAATLFIGRPEVQDSNDWSGGLRITPITDRVSAEAAIEFIVEQGEGTETARAGSHFDIFSSIARELDAKIAANPGFSASRDVLKNPLTRPHHDADPGFNIIDASTLAHPVAELFNHVYTSVLHLLMQFFDPAGETPEQRVAIRDSARRAMSGVVRPLGEILTTLPATKDPRGPTAGPPFELYGTLKMPANPTARLAIVSERFAAAAAETRRLSNVGDPSLARLDFLFKNLDLLSGTLSALAR